MNTNSLFERLKSGIVEGAGGRGTCQRTRTVFAQLLDGTELVVDIEVRHGLPIADRDEDIVTRTVMSTRPDGRFVTTTQSGHRSGPKRVEAYIGDINANNGHTVRGAKARRLDSLNNDLLKNAQPKPEEARQAVRLRRRGGLLAKLA